MTLNQPRLHRIGELKKDYKKRLSTEVYLCQWRDIRNSGNTTGFFASSIP